ncbi:MAG: hypothetical protein KIT45_11110 [Fimbriimonadia bacterium]|nr:hypothetical protein [Fimbriimonadia bacterium]
MDGQRRDACGRARPPARLWVKKAHGQGYKIRFWGALDVPAIWQAQYEAGVDYINTDRVAMLREFLLKRG